MYSFFCSTYSPDKCLTTCYNNSLRCSCLMCPHELCASKLSSAIAIEITLCVNNSQPS